MGGPVFNIFFHPLIHPSTHLFFAHILSYSESGAYSLKAEDGRSVTGHTNHAMADLEELSSADVHVFGLWEGAEVFASDTVRHMNSPGGARLPCKLMNHFINRIIQLYRVILFH